MGHWSKLGLGCSPFAAGDARFICGFLDFLGHGLADPAVENGRNYVIGMKFVFAYYLRDRVGGRELHRFVYA